MPIAVDAQRPRRALDRLPAVPVGGVLEHADPRLGRAWPQRAQRALDGGEFRRSARRLSEGADRQRASQRGGERRGAGRSRAPVRTRLLGLVLADHPAGRQSAGDPGVEVAVRHPASPSRGDQSGPRRYPERLCHRARRARTQDGRARDRRWRRGALPRPGRGQRRRDPGAGAQLRMGACGDLSYACACADRLDRRSPSATACGRCARCTTG